MLTISRAANKHVQYQSNHPSPHLTLGRRSLPTPTVLQKNVTLNEDSSAITKCNPHTRALIVHLNKTNLAWKPILNHKAIVPNLQLHRATVSNLANDHFLIIALCYTISLGSYIWPV
jgi:hypothetical protein